MGENINLGLKVKVRNTEPMGKEKFRMKVLPN